MKIQLLSDLHLEHCQAMFGRNRAQVIPGIVGDVLILAGDIAYGTGGLLQYAGLDIPVVYACGNHELYGSHMNLMMTEIKRCASGLGIHFLDNSTVVIGGVRFVGTTLWTDFEFYPGQQGRSMNLARAKIADFSSIRTMNGFFRPEDSVTIHRVSRRWLAQELSKPFDGPTVVVTHHAPSLMSVNARFLGDPLNPAFASDVDELAGKADVWCHGHMHDSSDYDWQGTRVLCNPRGYPLQPASDGGTVWENPAFNPAFTFEV